MHEKTLLYTALTVTTLAASYGVYKVRQTGGNSTVAITPVLLSDASRTVSQAEVPIRLTASDGTGLKLESLRAETAIEDPLALTELHLVFENPEDRILEGNFRITLPQGASLSRFAMKVGNTWQEGEVVEKQAARQAYEDFLHRRQDPALMEQGAGNEFSARVFPIPAKGKKEIVISYSEVLEAGSPYTLPLRGLPKLGALDIEVHASGSKITDASFGVHQTNFTPGQDFVVEGKQLPRSAGLRSGELAIARVVPFTGSRPEPVGSAVVLVDTSASRGLGLTEQAKLVRNVLAKLPSDAAITVACFDQEVVKVYEGKASGFGEQAMQSIIARGALGASDVEGAIAWAADTAKRTKARRVIMVGDGVATAGETDAQKLKDKVAALRQAGVDRMDALAVGGIRDDAFLRTVVRGVLDRDGVVLDGKLGADALARRLGESTSSGVPVKVEGAKWSWPEKLDGLQAGDEVMVFAEVEANKPVKVTVGTQTFSPDLKAADRPLVERAWAQAKIQSMIEAPTEDAATTKQKIIALSTRHRVLSPLTAMLVLETDFDYRRFGIDRNANVDILTVQNGRIALMHEAREWADEAEKTATITGNKGKDKESDGKQRAKEDAAKREQKVGGKTEEATITNTPGAASVALDDTTTTRPTGESRDPAAPRGPRGGDLGGLEDGDRPLDLLRANGEVGRGHQNTPPPPQEIPAPAATTAPVINGQLAQGASGASGEGRGGQPQGHAAARPRPTTPPSTGQALDGRFDNNRHFRSPAPSASGTFQQPNDGYLAPLREEAASAQVRTGTLVVEGGIAEPEIQRVLRGATPALRACYTNALAQNASLHGRMEVKVVVDSLGEVKNVDVTSAPNDALKACATTTFKTLRFPAPGTGDARFTSTFDFVGGGSGAPADVAQNNIPKSSPYEGRFATVMDDLAKGDKDGALDEAKKWQLEQPGDEMALVALGEAYEARGDVKTAARAYGSILELFSFRADSRRFAGERLERLDDPAAIKLAIDTYGKAAEQRPDHPASHRLFAYTLLKHGDYEKAFEAMKKGATRTYPSGRFLGADRILKEDLGIIAAAWARAEPGKRADIMSRLHTAGGTEENGPSLRFVLVWETDANDVDFHIYDAHGAHAYYGQKQLASGGELYADVTTGYGPECFTIRGAPEKRVYPYTLQAHYYSRGPMGYGMGKLEIIDHDGKGGLKFEERPFVVMKDRAFVDMGKVDRVVGQKTALK